MAVFPSTKMRVQEGGGKKKPLLTTDPIPSISKVSALAAVLPKSKMFNSGHLHSCQY